MNGNRISVRLSDGQIARLTQASDDAGLNTTDIVPTYTPDPSGPAYSSDYRLSSLLAVTYGVNLSWKPRDWLKLTLDYSRYNMRGTDSVTPQSAYPQANIYSAGAQLSW